MRLLSSLFVRSLGSSAIACGLTFTTGCGEATKPAAETAHHEGDGHAEHDEAGHPEEGPHNGHLIELGKEEYHAELVHDDATHTITLYLLDGSAKKMVPVADKELTINLVADGPVTILLDSAERPGKDGLRAAPLGAGKDARGTATA